MSVDPAQYPLLKLLRDGSPRLNMELVVVTVLSGLANALLLAVINSAAENASNEGANGQLLAYFVLGILAFVASQRHILHTSIVEVERILHDIRVRLSQDIRASDLLSIEAIGRAEIYASVNRDTLTISQATSSIVVALQSSSMVVFSVLYLAWLSKVAFILTVVLTWIGVTMHFRRSAEFNRDLQEATDRENEFFDALTDMLDGFKEVKLSAPRSRDLFARLRGISSAVADVKTRYANSFAAHFIFAQVAFYLLIASIVFLLPRLSPAAYSGVVVKATAAILFIIGPIGGIVASLPVFNRANLAAQNIALLEATLRATASAEPVADPQEEAIPAFREIRVEDVRFQYRDTGGGPSFAVGPLNLTLSAGETVFIVGGNGSGKSSFMKLLTGLYQPQQGRIVIDGVPVSLATAVWYRNHFSAVFSDYHLFDRLYGLRNVDARRVDEMLAVMQIDDKTSFRDGRFTNRDLSSGQKKRLALIAAVLEDRPILVFDEWAADQDPPFRKFFYEELLSRLKLQGRTIVAVTHDDKYFGVADRVLKMEYGQFVPFEDA